METHTRRVASTELADGAIHVSTVFLGVDHRFGNGRPILFETMVFYRCPIHRGGRTTDDEIQERYCTWLEAEAGHRRVVAEVRQNLQAWAAAYAGPRVN
jgi:hypothetical protein